MELINVRLQKSKIILTDGSINMELVSSISSAIVTPFLQVVCQLVSNPFESLCHIHNVLYALYNNGNTKNCYSFLILQYDLLGGAVPEIFELAHSHEEFGNHLMYEIVSDMEELIPQILDE